MFCRYIFKTINRNMGTHIRLYQDCMVKSVIRMIFYSSSVNASVKL